MTAPVRIEVATDPLGPALTLGDKLRVLRASLGWTTARCAARARTEPEIWERWEDDEVLPLERNLRALLADTHLDERALEQLLVHLPVAPPPPEAPPPRPTLTKGRGVGRPAPVANQRGGVVLEWEPVARFRLLRSAQALLAPGVRRVGVYLRADAERVLLLPAGPDDGRSATRSLGAAGIVSAAALGERLAAAGWTPGVYAVVGAAGGGVAIDRTGRVGEIRRWTRKGER